MKKKRFLWYLGGLVALVFGIVIEERHSEFFKDRKHFLLLPPCCYFPQHFTFISDCRIQSVLLRFASARFLWRLVESEI